MASAPPKPKLPRAEVAGAKALADGAAGLPKELVPVEAENEAGPNALAPNVEAPKEAKGSPPDAAGDVLFGKKEMPAGEGAKSDELVDAEEKAAVERENELVSELVVEKEEEVEKSEELAVGLVEKREVATAVVGAENRALAVDGAKSEVAAEVVKVEVEGEKEEVVEKSEDVEPNEKAEGVEKEGAADELPIALSILSTSKL